MPYVRFNGFDACLVRRILPTVIETVSAISAAPKDKVKVELYDVKRLTETPRSIEILMFPRPQHVHDAIASRLHALVASQGHTDAHIFFILLSPSLYYRDGVPLHTVSWLSAP
jgi:hypothetical protein